MEEEWTGGLGLADASCYIENGQTTRSYCIAYSTGNYTQYPVINHNGKEYEKECVCVCIYIYIYITETLCCTIQINGTLIYNIPQ